MAVLLTDEEFEAQIDAIDAEVDAERRDKFVRLYEAVSNAFGIAAIQLFILFCVFSWITPGSDIQSMLAFWISK